MAGCDAGMGHFTPDRGVRARTGGHTRPPLLPIALRSDMTVRADWSGRGMGIQARPTAIARTRAPLIVVALATALLALPAPRVAVAATLPAGFTESTIASGMSSPTAMAFAPDGRLFVAEQTGGLRVIKNDALLATPFVTLTVNSSGERGLLGVAFDPNFASNHYVYLYYTAPTPSVHNRLSRFTANGDVVVPGSEFVLLDLPNLSATNHNGGAIHFGPDGKLYVAVGENANGAQRAVDDDDPRKDAADQQRRLDPDGQSVLQHRKRHQPADLGAGRAQSVHVRVPGGHGTDVHQRRRAERVGGDQRRDRRVELRVAGYGRDDDEPVVPQPALRVRARQQQHDGVRDHGRRVLQPGDAAVPGELRRQVFLRRLLRRMDPAVRSRGRNRVGIRHGHQRAG